MYIRQLRESNMLNDCEGGEAASVGLLRSFRHAVLYPHEVKVEISGARVAGVSLRISCIFGFGNRMRGNGLDELTKLIEVEPSQKYSLQCYLMLLSNSKCRT